MEELKIVYLPLDKLTPYENNARKHEKADLQTIENSIKQFGMCDPIGIWSDKNIIVEGHGRLMALKELGHKEVPCIRLDHLTDEQRKAYAIAHNKTAEMSEWDIDKLESELAELQDFDMEQFGFDLSEFGIEEETEIIEDEVPEVDEENEPIVKRGEMWQLGKHRLRCGSSTETSDVAILMGGMNAKMLFTSPPYSDMREYEGGKNLDVEHISKFIEVYRPYTDYQCVNLGIQRKENDIVQYWDEYIKNAKNCGYKLMAWNVWDKTMCGSIGQQSAFIPIRHEWVFVFGTEFYDTNLIWDKKEESICRKKTQRKVRQPDGSMKYSTIGDTSNPKKKMESVLSLMSEQGSIRHEHPATFPVGLPAEYIKSMTKENDIVIEPFCGSGTTLIACEQTNRICYAMELEPKYCDVIIKRWETLTGKKAEKIV